MVRGIHSRKLELKLYVSRAVTAADSQRLKLPVGQLIGEASDEECVRRTRARVVCDVAKNMGEMRQLLLLKTVRRCEQDALQQLMRLSAQSAAFIKEPILTPLLAVGFTVLPLGGDQSRSCSDRTAARPATRAITSSPTGSSSLAAHPLTAPTNGSLVATPAAVPTRAEASWRPLRRIRSSFRSSTARG
jgi:hypothetical protein